MTLYIRSLIYNILFFGFTAPLLILFSPSLLISVKAANYVSSTWCWLNIWLLKPICNLRYQVIGSENIPDHPVVFASKHQSTWETLALIFILKGPVFILKKELLDIPFFGAFLKTADMIAIDRKAGGSMMRLIVDAVKDRLNKGRSVIIFPEGHRSNPGEHVKYQRGIASLYEHLNLPIVPVALNSGFFWPRKSFTKRPGVITVQFLPPIAPGLDRDQFMARLEDTIETASAKLATEITPTKAEDASIPKPLP